MDKHLNAFWSKAFFTFAAALLSHLALAEINFNGFATMTGGMTSSSDENLNGYDDELSFEPNSFIGLQANANLGDGLSAVAQIVSDGSDSWDSKIEWAYLGYEVNDNFKIVAGKQRLPLYLYSDYVDVSYAYHWITPPENAYAVPFSSVTGIGALLTNQIGNIDSRLHLLLGSHTAEFVLGGAPTDFESSNLLSVAWTLEYGALTFRLGHTQADIILDTPALEPLADAWVQASAGYSQIPDDPYNAVAWASFSDAILGNNGDDTADMNGVGFSYDNGSILAVAEYTSIGIDGSISQKETSGYYVSLGKHIGNFLPHITYGEAETTPTDPSFLSAVPSGVDDNLDTLVAVTRAQFASTISESSYYIVGLRWDFHPSSAFKIDYKSQASEIPLDRTDSLIRFALVTVF